MSDIMAISRHRMGTDGRGVTTLVGLYGCPLNCEYCINRSCHDTEIKRGKYSPEELINVISIDAPYFLMTNGGITFGGGEPLLQSSFIHKVCSLVDPRWTKTIETSLFSNWESIEMLVHDIDLWYVDVKAVDSETYRKYTGQDNRIVLENLKALVELVGVDRVCVRYPVIPEYSTIKNREEGIRSLLSNIHPELQIERFEYIKY